MIFYYTIGAIARRYRMHKKKQLLQNEAVWRFKIPLLSLNVISFILILLLIITSQTVRSQETSPQATIIPAPCSLPPIAVPTLPDKIPGYTELDPDTQLHVTGTAQAINLDSYSLEITGEVMNPLILKYDDLRCMPKIESRPTLVCPGFFEDTASWSGVSLDYLLKRADVKDSARHIRLVSADGYAALVDIKEARSGKSFLAYQWEGQPIPVLHGFPVRAVFPDSNGNKWVKWLVRIEVQ